MSPAHNPVHGNYHGYYSKRPAAAHDPRLSLLPPGTLKGKRVLDIGCNEGWVTCEIALSYGATEVVGVDIDDALVRAAWKRRRSVWSQHAREGTPSVQAEGPSPSVPAGLRIPLENTNSVLDGQANFLPAQLRPHSDAFPSAFEHMFGPLPIPPTDRSIGLPKPSFGQQTDTACDASPAAPEFVSEADYSDEEWNGFQAGHDLGSEEDSGSETASEFDLADAKIAPQKEGRKSEEKEAALQPASIAKGNAKGGFVTASSPSLRNRNIMLVSPHLGDHCEGSESAKKTSSLRSPGACTFPHNLVFRKSDWAQDAIVEDRNGWDVVLALSVTKWIHLNEGDEGIRRLFRRAFDTLRPGGVFIVEPQEWDTYAKARRMDQRLRENAQKLHLRPADFERVLLQEIGFHSVEHLGYAGKGGFSRPLDLYRK